MIGEILLSSHPIRGHVHVPILTANKDEVSLSFQHPPDTRLGQKRLHPFCPFSTQLWYWHFFSRTEFLRDVILLYRP